MADLSELLGRTLVVVAHPDDETVGCGAFMQRIERPVVAFATDGAPRGQFFWGKYGSRLQYQRIREQEARNALGRIGVSEIEFFGGEPLASGEGIADQELHLNLEKAHDRLIWIMTRCRPDAILTLAYEGGHPDHDCCSILGAWLGERRKLPVWEFPLYHRAGPAGVIRQRFIREDGREGLIAPTSDEVANKKNMIQAYSSQHPFLLDFDPAIEVFRPQNQYDYSRPPHEGTLNYEAWGWPIRGADVCAAYRAFTASHSAVGQ